jgi:hypothetical protein
MTIREKKLRAATRSCIVKRRTPKKAALRDMLSEITRPLTISDCRRIINHSSQ